MRQVYCCHNCGAPVVYGDRFCGSCGINLNCGIQKMVPPSSPLSYEYQYPNQQTGWCQQPERNQPPPYSQAPVWGDPNQYQQQYMYGDRGTIPRKKSSSVGGTMKPIHTEIIKLLADFFDKQIKYNKV